MEKKTGFSTLDEFLQSPDEMKQKLIMLKRSSSPFLKKMENPERIKFWLAIIPEQLADKVRSFYRLVKVKNSVKVYTRHKVIVDYDTLFLAKQINESERDDFLLITNARLSMMRSVICLYLAYTKDGDYHRGWTHISYVLMSLGATEEETLLIFTHLVQNVLPGFSKASENHAVKMKYVTEFYMLAERQRYSFCTLGHNSIFKSQRDDAEIFEYADPRTKLTLFHNPNLKNYALFVLLKATCDDWFGSLFSISLFPKDCLVFWDHLLIHNHRLLFKFGLTLLTKMNAKLEQSIKKERKGYNEAGLESTQHHLLLMSPFLKKQLTGMLPSNEFNSIILGALDRRDSALLLASEKKNGNILQELPMSLASSRIASMNELKKELGAQIPLDTGRIMTIFQIVEDFKGEKIAIKDFIGLLSNGQIAYPSLAAKIFILLDINLRGYLKKKEIRMFFAFLADSFDRKIKLFWKDASKEKNFVSAEEAIELLQTVDFFLNPDSTIISENTSTLYERILYSVPDLIVSAENFVQIIKHNKNCFHIFKHFHGIEGQDSLVPVVQTESDEDDVERTEDLKFEKSHRSQRLSSPTYHELLSSNLRRKSGFGLEVEKEKSAPGILKEDSMTDDFMRSKGDETQTNSQTPLANIMIASIANTDENLPGIKPPSLNIRWPIMSPDQKQKFTV